MGKRSRGRFFGRLANHAAEEKSRFQRGLFSLATNRSLRVEVRRSLGLKK
jgi:hypothetical protein